VQATQATQLTTCKVTAPAAIDIFQVVDLSKKCFQVLLVHHNLSDKIFFQYDEVTRSEGNSSLAAHQFEGNDEEFEVEKEIPSSTLVRYLAAEFPVIDCVGVGRMELLHVVAHLEAEGETPACHQ